MVIRCTFLFNVYRQWETSVMREERKKEIILLYSKEGITQDCPLMMVGYRILVLPLIIKLKE